MPATLTDMLLSQVAALHTASLDALNRASRPDRGDSMAVRLRGNALAMMKMQLALIACTQPAASDALPDAARAAPTAPGSADETLPPQQAAAQPETHPEPPAATEPEPDPEAGVASEPDTTGEPAGFTEPGTHGDANPPGGAEHSDAITSHLLTGDTLSRFISTRLPPDQSPHAVWQQLQSGPPPAGKRKPA